MGANFELSLVGKLDKNERTVLGADSEYT